MKRTVPIFQDDDVSHRNRNHVENFVCPSSQDDYSYSREVELALAHPDLPSFNIYYVSQLPEENQETELRRMLKQIERREEETRQWSARMEEFNSSLLESMRHQAVILAGLGIGESGSYNLNPAGVRTDLLTSNFLTDTGSSSSSSAAGHSHTATDEGDDENKEHKGKSTSITNAKISLGLTVKAKETCPFCSKSLTVQCLPYHVNYVCKMAHKELKPRDNFQFRKKQ